MSDISFYVEDDHWNDDPNEEAYYWGTLHDLKSFISRYGLLVILKDMQEIGINLNPNTPALLKEKVK